MVGRGEITDKAWEQIALLLPDNGRRGGQWSEHRKVVNGILWRLRTGAPWRDLPSCYGPWQTCYDRFVRWRRDGTWDRLLAHVQTKSDAVGEVEWEVSVDDTVVRAHQHAAGARTRPSHKDLKRGLATRWRKRSEEAVEAFLLRSISPAMAKAGHFQWFSRPDKGTQARNLEMCSMAFGYHVLRV
jgi:transposase